MNCPPNKECERKCQICGEHPANYTIKNKYNGKVMIICDDCRNYVFRGVKNHDS